MTINMDQETADLTSAIHQAYEAHQHALRSLRTRQGLERARQAGTRLGRPPVWCDEYTHLAEAMHQDGSSAEDIAFVLGVSRATVYRHWKPS